MLVTHIPVFQILCANVSITSRNKGTQRDNSTSKRKKLQDDVTVVTSYLNLGTFKKGALSSHSPETYVNWMRVFKYIENPVVAFFEDDDAIAMFQKVRSVLFCNMTKIYKIKKESLWSFSLRDRIHKIYSSPHYPQHHPNTVLPEYSCVMHAKYDFVQRAAEENPFNTKYLSWLDIGYFRDVPHDSEPFSLYIPPDFDNSKVAYGRVYPFNSEVRTVNETVEQNLVWVGGGLFLARVEVMIRWVTSYMQFTEKMLNLGWMSTDQQVLYAMHLPQHLNDSHKGVELQIYDRKSPYSIWFSFGYICKDEGQKRRKPKPKTTRA